MNKYFAYNTMYKNPDTDDTGEDDGGKGGGSNTGDDSESTSTE